MHTAPELCSTGTHPCSEQQYSWGAGAPPDHQTEGCCSHRMQAPNLSEGPPLGQPCGRTSSLGGRAGRGWGQRACAIHDKLHSELEKASALCYCFNDLRIYTVLVVHTYTCQYLSLLMMTLVWVETSNSRSIRYHLSKPQASVVQDMSTVSIPSTSGIFKVQCVTHLAHRCDSKTSQPLSPLSDCVVWS